MQKSGITSSITRFATAMFAVHRIGLTKANSMCSNGTTGKHAHGLAELAPPLFNGLRTSCPQKQGTRELPREFLITFNSFNLLTHSLAVTASAEGTASAAASELPLAQVWGIL